MKKYAYLTLTFVLTAALLMGCGCTNQSKKPTMPTTMPTQTTQAPTTQPTTRATTEPTTSPSSMPTVDNGNGPLEDQSTNAATTDQAEARSRSNMGVVR